MAVFKTLVVLAFVAVVSSSPLFGRMEHHLFGLPLPHTNNPIAHNLENMLTHGLEDITGIHSRGNDKPMKMDGMDMGGGSGMAGMNMGGGGGGGIFGDVGTLLGLGGGPKRTPPASSSSIDTSGTASASGSSNVDRKQLLQYLKLLQAQQKASSNPSSDEILRYVLQNTKPAADKKIKYTSPAGSGESSDELQQKLAALVAGQGER